MGSLYLVRHGQASFLEENYDRLSEKGEGQARRLGEHFARLGVPFDRVYAGPRARQRRTAELFAAAYAEAGHALPAPVVLDALDEMRADEVMKRALPELADGDPEIRRWMDEIREAGLAAGQRQFQKVFTRIAEKWIRAELAPPGVEPWADFCARVTVALSSLRAEGAGQRIIAFTSAGPVAVGMRVALSLGDQDTLNLVWGVRNSSLSEFLYSRERFSVASFNTMPHLPDPAHWTHR